MTFEDYSHRLSLNYKKELEKVSYVAYFLYKYDNKPEFLLTEVLDLLKQINISISNRSRIKLQLKDSKRFRTLKDGLFALTSKGIKELSEIIENELGDSDTIVTSNGLFDLSIFLGTRGYLDCLFRQIDNCYSNNCYDACAVLIRRILEILLIESYVHLGIDNIIKDNNGNYMMLEGICSDAAHNLVLNLSRNTKDSLSKIRDLGNFAAHKITYNTRKSDIDKLASTIRVCFEELYYKAGLKK